MFRSALLFFLSGSLFQAQAVTLGPRLKEVAQELARAPGALSQHPLPLLAVGREQSLWAARMRSYGIPVEEKLGVVRIQLLPAQIPLLFGNEAVRVDLGARFFPLLDLSAPAMGITEGVRSFRAGKDVLLALVDTGIDLTHPDFHNPDGSTRFVAYWDQTYPKGSSTGTVCDALMIDEGSCPNFPEEPLETILPLGHGTHVAGIAGGSHIRYRGIAPDALLVGVRIRFDEAGLVDALAWLEELANRWQKPMVVNLSLGSNEGPHDGSFPSEIAIDRFVREGRIVVAAAGNEGTLPTQAGGIHVRIPAGTEIYAAQAEFKGLSRDETHLEVWGDRSTAFEMAMALVSRSGELGEILSFTPWISSQGSPASTSYTLYDQGKQVASLLIAPDATSTASGFRITLSSLGSQLSSYRYQLWVRNPGGLVDAWLTDRDMLFAPLTGTTTLTLPPSGTLAVRFVPGDSQFIITLPGTARRVLTATGYVTRNLWVSRSGTQLQTDHPLGTLLDVASYGPTRDGRGKPDFALPGEYIASALSTKLSFFPEDFRVDETHGLLRGTSMAVPHLSGALALILEENPRLTPEEAQELLKGWSSPRFPLYGWGHGVVQFSSLTAPVFPLGNPTDSTPPRILSLSAQRTSRGWKVEFTTSELARAALLFAGGEVVSSLRYGERHRFQGSGSPPSERFQVRLSDPRGNTLLSSAYTLPPRGCGCTLLREEEKQFPLAILLLGLITFLLFWAVLRRPSRCSSP